MNPFEKYGIKEVADAIFFSLDENGQFDEPVLVLDTLKISTVEETAETAEARGGKGSPRLITWDYNKDITVTLQDALISMKAMAMMRGGAATEHAAAKLVKKAETKTLSSDLEFTTSYGADGDVFVLETGEKLTPVEGVCTSTLGTAGDVVRIVYDVEVDAGKVYEIVIKPETFPGTYGLVGDTVIRNTNGVDEGFQFIIPRAKINSETTLTLEGEGDPAVFDMTITVMKAANGSMMSLVKYDLGEPGDEDEISNLADPTG